jgi:hypothetical protein
MYSVDTLRPYGFPVIEADFSASQICHPMTHMHTRGRLLAITCEDGRDRPDRLGFDTKLIDWRTSKVLLSVRCTSTLLS